MMLAAVVFVHVGRARARRAADDTTRARRVFVGRDFDGQSLVTLSDRDGRPRLRLQVDTAGNPSIVFLDEQGRTVKSITP